MHPFSSTRLAVILVVVHVAVLVVSIGTTAQERGKSEGSAKQEAATVRDIEVIVDGGYAPNRIEIGEGERVRLKFVRREYTPCTREIVIPSLNIRRELPPHKAVTVELPPLNVGELAFKCGMNMIRGTLLVVPRKNG